MEKDGKMKNQRSEKKENREKGSGPTPLQDLNIKKPSNLSFSSSSSSAAAAAEAPKGCLRFSLSSKTSSSSSSHSSSRTHLHKMPKIFSKTADTSKVISRSKENDPPRKPFSQKSKEDQPRWQRRKNIAKPISKENGKRSELPSGGGNILNKSKNGSLKFQANVKNNSQGTGSISGELPSELLELSNSSNLNFTDCSSPPVSKCGSDSSMIELFSLCEGEKDNNSSTIAVKTPPIVSSLSPEIQCQSHYKIPVSKSAATPICYGAGHLVSGVTDKRKCRRRGSLKGGVEKSNLFYDETSDMYPIDDSRYPPVPLLAEASVRWSLSPGDEDKGSDSRLEKCRSFGVDNVVEKRRNRDGISSSRGENIIQTPKSDSSPDTCVRRSRLELHGHGKFVRSGMDSLTESSWVSDDTKLDDLALSRVRISWRDSLIVDTAEYDLSDKEDKEIHSLVESDDHRDNGLVIDDNDDLSPILLDYEPLISVRGKEKTTSSESNAESICTNGSGLVASSDSDWTYFNGGWLCI
ncbi:hypothetical protein OROGR_016265 [Orobanche gracilis]